MYKNYNNNKMSDEEDGESELCYTEAKNETLETSFHQLHEEQPHDFYEQRNIQQIDSFITEQKA